MTRKAPWFTILEPQAIDPRQRFQKSNSCQLLRDGNDAKDTRHTCRSNTQGPSTSLGPWPSGTAWHRGHVKGGLPRAACARGTNGHEEKCPCTSKGRRSSSPRSIKSGKTWVQWLVAGASTSVIISKAFKELQNRRKEQCSSPTASRGVPQQPPKSASTAMSCYGCVSATRSEHATSLSRPVVSLPHSCCLQCDVLRAAVCCHVRVTVLQCAVMSPCSHPTLILSLGVSHPVCLTLPLTLSKSQYLTVVCRSTAYHINRGFLLFSFQ